jgi:RNA polymerase sigma factor (sigma-70 family)
MTRDSAIPTENLEEILDWLNPDRDVAGTMYVQLRHDLARIFTFRRCADPEGLTDEVFDRVARKVHDVRRTYEGDPRHYFRAVANNLIKENLKKFRFQVPLEGIDPPEQKPAETEEEIAGREECLRLCLQKVSPEKQELIVAYYDKEKQAKIDNRSELARQLGISLETLRVRVYRIRLSLQECIESCLEIKARQK